jgi:hypothetical protein
MAGKAKVGNPLTLPARFWAKVNKDGPVMRPGLGPCWVWTGAKSKGYGQIDKRPAHVVSLEFDGRPVPKGQQGCHHCDNHPCVRPDHLFVGTPKQNTRDMIAKRRNVTGERVCTAKLTAEQVTEIRRRYEAGETQVSLAAAFGVRQPHVSSIVRGCAWRAESTGQMGREAKRGGRWRRSRRHALAAELRGVSHGS